MNGSHLENKAKAASFTVQRSFIKYGLHPAAWTLNTGNDVTYPRLLSVFVLAAAFSLPTALAQEADTGKDPAKEETQEAKPKGRLAERGEKRRKRIMEAFKATGEVKSCVPMRSLRQSSILDDQTIFFESIGRKGYMNRLPTECRGLMREERFAYADSFGALCRGEIITILDSFGRTWGSCSLGDFEEYEKTPKTDANK